MGCTARECSHVKAATGPHCLNRKCPNYLARCDLHRPLEK